MNQEMERQKSVELTKKLADMEGRRPRLYMADMEEDHSKEKRKLAATTSTNSTAMTLYRTLLRFSAFFFSSSFSALGST